MASGQLSRTEALACSGYRHACHVMLYCDTKAQLFGRFPIRHIILMQMRYDGLLGFPGGLVNPSEESLEAGLGRELQEELGVAVPVSVEDHVESRHVASPYSSHLIAHFYVKKMEEEQIREIERAAVCTATDYGQEVLGMVRVPLYTLKSRAGLSLFLSHSFIGNSRSQLVDSLLRLNMVAPEELHTALARSREIHKQTGEELRALAQTQHWRKRF